MIFILLSQNSLTVLSKAQTLQPLVFPDTILRHQEIVDKVKFEQLLKDYFIKLPKDQAIIVLSNEMVFQKTITQTTEIVLTDEEEKFIATVPFAESSIQKVVIPAKSEVTFLATNSDIYQGIIGCLEQLDWQVHYVLPLTLFTKYIPGNEVSYSALAKASRDKGLLAKGNFLQKVKEDGEEHQETNHKSLPKQIILLVICLIFLLGAILFALNQSHLLPFAAKQNNTPIRTAPTTVPKLTPTPTSSSSATQKIDNLTVQILNGSGIPGQATEMKDKLTAGGFKNITTGNSGSTGSSATKVTFSKSVSKSTQSALITILNQIFSTVETNSSSSSSEFDISIVTGNGVK